MAASSWLCSIYVDIVARTESVVFQNSQWWEDAALIAIRVLVLRLTEPFHTLVTGCDSPIWTKNPRSWAERSRGGGCLTTSMAVREAAVRTNMYRHRWSWGEALLQFCASLSQPPMRVGEGYCTHCLLGEQRGFWKILLDPTLSTSDTLTTQPFRSLSANTQTILRDQFNPDQWIHYLFAGN